MVEITDIKDRDSLRRWLEETGQSREVCVWLAHRAALRVLPVYWDWAVFGETSHKRELVACSILRSCLISRVAAVAPTHDIKIATDAAYASAIASASAASATAAAYATAAADAAYAAATSTAATATAYAADVTAYSAAATDAADAYAYATDALKKGIWRSLRWDCTTFLETSHLLSAHSAPLWSGDQSDGELWSDLRLRLQSADEDWSFWITWYDHTLAGTETREGLLKRIALSDLPSDGTVREPEDYDVFWEGTDAEVNARVNAIWAEWQAAQRVEAETVPDDDQLDRVEARTYNAETVSFDNVTAHWRTDPVTGLAPVHLEEAVAEIEELLNRLRDERGRLRNPFPLETELDMLAGARQRIGAPRRLHSLCKSVLRRLQPKIANADCPPPDKDPDMADLVGTLLDVSATLINRDPEVKEAVALTDNAPDIAPDSEEAGLFVEASIALEPISQGPLAEDFGLLAQIVVSPDVSVEERREAIFVLSGRILRVLRGMAAWEKELRDRVTDINGALKPYVDLGKNAIWLTGVATVPVWVPGILQLILRLFG